MAGKIPVEELLPETRKKLKLESRTVNTRLPVLGRILAQLDGLSNRDALWILRTAINHVKGYHERGTHLR